ncbi:hypothetical protein T492DRAFT_952312, partial [Pavlovales sp. CCMP2436]
MAALRLSESDCRAGADDPASEGSTEDSFLGSFEGTGLSGFRSRICESIELCVSALTPGSCPAACLACRKLYIKQSSVIGRRSTQTSTTSRTVRRQLESLSVTYVEAHVRTCVVRLRNMYKYKCAHVGFLRVCFVVIMRRIAAARCDDEQGSWRRTTRGV